jgi:uncharacterized alpha-E superfamily protein
LLDIKCHLHLPRVSDVGSPIDIGQWNALLRSAGAYHPYRRMERRGVMPARVAAFLLLNPDFSRSVLLCTREADRLLSELRERYGLKGGSEAAARITELRDALSALSVREVLGQGLHEFLDLVQRRLIAVTHGMSTAFFTPLELDAQEQSQFSA